MMPWACACSSASSTGSTIGTSVCGFERALRQQQVGERRAFHERHDVEDEPFAVADEMDRDGVLVIEPGDGAGFLLEAGTHAVGPRHVRPQHLHRQAAVQFDVADLEYVGEATLRQSPHDDVLGAQRLAQGMDQFGVTGQRIVRRTDARRAPLATAARTGDMGHGAEFGGAVIVASCMAAARRAHPGPHSPAGSCILLRVSKR